jgi:hypothetical protein
MAVSTQATFRAEFPNDAKWDENGTPLIPGGEAVTRAIYDGFRRCGVPCSDVVQRSVYGWQFDFNNDGTRFICVVQAYESDQWLLIFDLPRSGWRRLFSSKSNDTITLAAKKIHQLLISDSRFSNIRWYNRKQFKKGGSPGTMAPSS